MGSLIFAFRNFANEPKKNVWGNAECDASSSNSWIISQNEHRLLQCYHSVALCTHTHTHCHTVLLFRLVQLTPIAIQRTCTRQFTALCNECVSTLAYCNLCFGTFCPSMSTLSGTRDKTFFRVPSHKFYLRFINDWEYKAESRTVPHQYGR